MTRSAAGTVLAGGGRRWLGTCHVWPLLEPSELGEDFGSAVRESWQACELPLSA